MIGRKMPMIPHMDQVRKGGEVGGLGDAIDVWVCYRTLLIPATVTITHYCYC